VPFGLLNPGALDACTHVIPHDAMWKWAADLSHDVAAYPYRIPFIRLYGPTPRAGELAVEARFAGFDGDGRYPTIRMQIAHEGTIWASLRMVEILMPKGPIGSADPADRLAFLRGEYVAGLGLSTQADGVTTLAAAAVQASNWLPGTVQAVYGVDSHAVLLDEVAVKDHIAARAGCHPRHVVDGLPATEPFTRYPVAIERRGTDVVVRDDGDPRLDLEPIVRYWDPRFAAGRWPTEDVYYGLMERFVGRVRVPDPDALEAVRGRSCLFLANHQVGVESLLFSIIASVLVESPTVVLAKAEHRTTWLGKLIALCFDWPGVVDPKVIEFFDRADRESLPRIVGELGRQMATGSRSVMVHVEGTRSVTCNRPPVQKMSSLFIDMALRVDAPIVPVRFTGGLPVEPLEKRLEFPLGHGRQDYWFGTPILPEQLEALPLKERKDMVIAGMNDVGPAWQDERPSAGDSMLAAATAAHEAETGVSPEHAAIYQALRARDSVGPHIAALLAGESFDDGPQGVWMTELRSRLLGE
jgi:1-acyl-sn-glycerol-3-phosphate acyltransferase